MFNKIIIVGHLTKDVDLRYAPTGTPIGNTSIATTRKFKSGDGLTKEEVLFVDVTFFGRTAEVANQYLRKGSKLLVEGRLKLDNWTDKEGQNRSKHSIVVENMTMLGDKEKTSETATPQTPQAERGQGRVVEIDLNEEEIPF